MAKKTTKKFKAESWTTIAEKYGCDHRTLKANCKSIKDQLDKLAGGREAYRFLNLPQIALIKSIMGPFNNEE